MIKFFRKIRQNLLMENKTGKYFKYAIGEILLVVIGILIALQINNWNISRLEQETEIKILEEIYSNLSTDVRNINQKIRENSYFLNANQNVLTHLKEKTVITKSLERDYASLFGQGDFRPVTIGYENLKSRGVSIIKNDSLRSTITELYDSKYYSIVGNIEYVQKGMHEARVKSFTDNLTTIKPFQSGRPNNLKKLQNDLSFQEILTWNVFILTWIEGQFTNGIEEMVFTQKMINEELIRIKK